MNANDTNLANDFAKARDLRQELRRLEESIARRAERAPITEEDEREWEKCRRGPMRPTGRRSTRSAPLPLERPAEYHRRLLDGVKGYSPRWKSADLNVVTDETALSVIEQQIYADAATHGRTQGLRAREIKQFETRTPAGHVAYEFVGGEEAHFTQQFSREPRLGIFRTQAEYAAMSRDAQIVAGGRDRAHYASAALGSTGRVLNQFGGWDSFSSQLLESEPTAAFASAPSSPWPVDEAGIMAAAAKCPPGKESQPGKRLSPLHFFLR